MPITDAEWTEIERRAERFHPKAKFPMDAAWTAAGYNLIGIPVFAIASVIDIGDGRHLAWEASLALGAIAAGIVAYFVSKRGWRRYSELHGRITSDVVNKKAKQNA